MPLKLQSSEGLNSSLCVCEIKHEKLCAKLWPYLVVAMTMTLQHEQILSTD